MADAEVVPIGTGGRPGRGSGASRPSAAARGLAGAARAPRAAAPPLPPVPPEGPAEEPTPLGVAPEPAPAAGSDAEPGHPGADPGADPGRGIPAEEILAALLNAAREVFGESWEPELARFLAVLRHRLTGDYDIDAYGFDRELTERLMIAFTRPLAHKWFRIEVRGIENLPATGGALVVSNHSGTIPVDGLMAMTTIQERTGRFLRPLAADLVFRTPLVGALARRSGATLACQDDAERMLRAGELVGVWPEGFKGIGKPYSERYKLQRFGRGGFVSAALRTGVPIVPLSVVGAEEIYPLIGNVPALARLLGVPYLPITPLFPWLGPLGMIPLPSKWLLEFGEPIHTDEYDEAAADDPMLMFNVTDQVRETIQHTLYRLLAQRGSAWR